jgi:hypothetical protein
VGDYHPERKCEPDEILQGRETDGDLTLPEENKLIYNWLYALGGVYENV